MTEESEDSGRPEPAHPEDGPEQGDSSRHHPMFDGPYDKNETDRPDEDPTEASGEVGWAVNAVGNLGVGLGACALGLAVLGLILGLFRIEPIASLSLVLSLVLVTISMIFGMVFQAFGTSNSLLLGRS
jgi:hypothetical protein